VRLFRNMLFQTRTETGKESWISNCITYLLFHQSPVITLHLQFIFFRMVMSYLVHHGYCSTAEAFAKTCGQIVAEDLVSMQNRQSNG
jgi:hypothetical protein